MAGKAVVTHAHTDRRCYPQSWFSAIKSEALFHHQSNVERSGISHPASLSM